jgi:hypothetical protein
VTLRTTMTRGRWSLLLVLALAGAAVGGLAIFAKTSTERVAISAPPSTPPSATTSTARPALATRETTTPGPRYAAFDCAHPAGLAARVDDVPIQLADLCTQLARLGGVTPNGTERQQARHVLDRMIDALLVRRALGGATVSEAELTAALGAMQPKLGADVELVAAQLRERLALEKLVKLRGADLAVTQQDIDAELAIGAPGIARGQGTQVEGFLARIAPGTDDTAARQRAEAFAKQPTDATGMTPLAPFVVGDTGVEPALEAAAASLAPGAWSGALRTRVGYAVIRVIGTSPGEAVDTPGLRERVRTALETRKRAVAQQRLLEELRAVARIETLVDI